MGSTLLRKAVYGLFRVGSEASKAEKEKYARREAYRRTPAASACFLCHPLTRGDLKKELHLPGLPLVQPDSTIIRRGSSIGSAQWLGWLCFCPGLGKRFPNPLPGAGKVSADAVISAHKDDRGSWGRNTHRSDNNGSGNHRRRYPPRGPGRLIDDGGATATRTAA